MRRWVLATWITIGAAAAAEPARAEPEASGASGEGGEGEAAIGAAIGAALPGGRNAPTADVLPRGALAVTALGGFGWRSGLVGDDHRFGRGVGDLSLAYAPAGGLSIALALAGRYDRHFGVSPSGDDNYVGDPRLAVRLSRARGAARLGGQLTLWAPGGDAPSITLDALTVEARALAALRAGGGSVGFSAGFRYDRSARAIDDPKRYSVHERISLGVSDFHAIVGSAHASFPLGARAFAGAEASLDLFVGDGAPGPILRAGAHGGVRVAAGVALVAFTELAHVPAIAASALMSGVIPIIAYEPAITAGLGVQARFGEGARRGPGLAPHVRANAAPAPVAVIEHAELAGVVTDELGQPVVGATVTARLRDHTATGTTGPRGEYVIPKVPIGKTVDGTTTLDDTAAEIEVAVAGKKPSTATVSLVRGRNQIPPLALEPELPPAEVKALVSAAASGRVIAGATVTIEPGGYTATSGPDGKVALRIPPGTYKITAVAPGYRPQTLDLTIDTHGVALKNFELSRK